MKIDQKIYLAPFQGVTTYTFREVYTSYFHGTDKLYTPFFTAVHKSKSLDKKGPDLNFIRQNGIKVVPQILSKDADEILRFADYCSKKGFSEINWNLGCPFPRVANKKRGSGMLPFPDEAHNILSELEGKMDVDFSIKCRLGYYSEEEIFPMIDVFNEHNISELIVHARIGKQLYSGAVNEDVFGELIYKCKLPLAYNGDIFSKSDFDYYNGKFKVVDNWMIGRGMLRNPFLPAILKAYDIPSLEEQKLLVYKFVTSLYMAYRKKTNNRPHAISIMKEYWSYLSYSFSDPQKVFGYIKKSKTFDEYEDAVAKVFSDYDWVAV
jgi:tRNA-dihydrouridine synthase